MRRSKAGLDGQHLSKALDGVLVLSHGGDHVAEVVERGRIIRPQSKRPPKMRFRLLVQLQPQQRCTQVVMHLGIVCTLAHRTGQIAHCIRILCAVEAHDTQQMQCVEMSRVARDQFEAAALGLGIVARMVVACGRHHSVA